MSLVAGIDQSVRGTGICVLDEKAIPIKIALITPPKKLKDEQRLAFIRDRLDEIFSALPSISVVVMEGYSYGSLNKPFMLGEIGALIKLKAVDLGATLYTVAPKQRAKFATGSGSADKDKVIAAVTAKWGTALTDDNLADAYVLGMIGHGITYGASSRRYEIEILKAITKKDLPSSKRSTIKKLPLSV